MGLFETLDWVYKFAKRFPAIAQGVCNQMINFPGGWKIDRVHKEGKYVYRLMNLGDKIDIELDTTKEGGAKGTAPLHISYVKKFLNSLVA